MVDLQWENVQSRNKNNGEQSRPDNVLDERKSDDKQLITKHRQ